MLPAPHRLTSRHEITAAIRRGRRRGSTLLVVHVAPSARPGPARAAFAVSSAVGNSVVRHRLIRQLRSASMGLLSRLPDGTDIVVRALPAAHGASYASLVAALEHCLRDDLRPPDATDGHTHQPGAQLADPQVAGNPPGDDRATMTWSGRALFILGSPFRWVLIVVVTGYRQLISPVLPPTCRYHPSCSAYALESLGVHGVAKAVVLSAWRILRCNPFTKGGLDPVPPRGAWRPSINPDGSPRHPGPSGPLPGAVG